MKVNINWLKDYVTPNIDIHSLADKLTMVGLEVEAVTERYAYLDDFVVAKILEMQKHPDADKLTLCRVDSGNEELSVVCGAHNMKTGDLVALAKIGVTLPDGMVVQKTTIRGQVSYGMLCSDKELNLNDDHSGIKILNPNCRIGDPLGKALNLNDIILEIGLTPNRADCLSTIGIAREIASILKQKVNYPKIVCDQQGDPIEKLTSVTLLAPDLCPRYAARVLTNVKVGPSPFWLKDRLESVGLRSINNIVDVTNYVMLEYGQPLHAFDYDRLEENRIIVRKANPGELFTTLDKKERQLNEQMLMICDGKKPVAVGGVMGGLNSEIRPDTTRVLLESAYFNPISIRKTSKTLALNTDASYRFARGIDPEGVLNAINRAAQMMVDVSGAVMAKGIIDAYPVKVPSRQIRLTVAHANRLIGSDISQKEMVECLESIEFSVNVENSESMTVVPPTYRVDIERPEDIIEEIARLTGYQNIKIVSPKVELSAIAPSKGFLFRRKLRQMMTGLGFREAINYSFIRKQSPQNIGLGQDDERSKCVELLNPLSEDQTVMRTSLVPGILENMDRNLKQQNRNLKLFEIGKTFINENNELPKEKEMLIALWTGDRIQKTTWHTKDAKCDFYDIKGVCEQLLQNFHISNIEYVRVDKSKFPYLRPNYSAEILVDGNSIGVFGEVHPNVINTYDLKQQAYIIEADIAKLMKCVPEQIGTTPLPKFPYVNRDLTLILDKPIEVIKVLNSIKQHSEKLVESIDLVAVYEGEPIPEKKKSVTFRLTFRSWEDTLKDSEVNRVHNEIARHVITEFGAGLP